MAKSKIEWTERTWNPVSGCSKVSAGCKNCYAENYANRFWGARKFTDIMLHEDKLNYPLTVKKPSMFFVNSMSDLFHKDVPDEFIIKIFTTMMLAPQHTFQILTKRAERMKIFVDKFMNGVSLIGNAKTVFRDGMKSQVLLDYVDKNKFPENIWLGVSVENNEAADRIKFLKDTKCDIKFVSFEPLLENLTAVNIHRWEINWVIIGCESGAKRRECDIRWVTNLADYFENKSVPVFVKQLSINGKVEKDIKNFPEHLQIRNFPK